MIWQLFVAAGMPRPVACEDDLLPGRLVKHFIYDGVGRLVRTSSPIEAPEGFELSYTDGGMTYYVSAINRSERFFYDGTRRIQELITDPVLVTAGEHDTVSMSDEVYQSQTGGSTALNGMYVRAQYIWGPGDGTNGVDELLCQLDPRDTSSSTYTNGGGKPWYILTDAQGDVVSITHLPTGSNQVIEVGGQWTYTPYGEVLTYEKLHPHPAVVFGHKTLPVDRLDAPALGWDTGGEGYSAETRRLVPGARLLGYNRGRTTNFKFGRFMQGDPNAAGTTALTGMMFHGEAPTAFELAVDVQQRAGDGLNLFSYLRNSPLMHFDPMGLSTDPFDMVDDFVATNAASQAAFMSRIVKGFNTTAHIAFQIAQLHPAVGMAVAAYNIASGQGSLWDVASLIPGGAVSKLIGRAASEFAIIKGAYATGGLAGFAKKAANTKVGVWAMGVGERGLAIEKMIMSHLPGSKLADGFKTFDKWDDATATAYSIKSLNLGAASYQNASAITSRISKMASDAASFTYGAREQFKLYGHQIRSRVVVLGIPPGATGQQMTAIREGIERARSLKVEVRLMEIP